MTTTMTMTTMTMMREWRRKGAEGWAVRGVRLEGRQMMLEGGARRRGVVQACHLLIDNVTRVMILTVFDLVSFLSTEGHFCWTEQLTWQGLGQQHRRIPALHHSSVPQVLKLERQALQRAVPVTCSTCTAKAVLVNVLR